MPSPPDTRRWSGALPGELQIAHWGKVLPPEGEQGMGTALELQEHLDELLS